MKTMTRWLPLGAVLASLLTLTITTTAAPVPGISSPLAQVPAEAPLVIHLHGIERTFDRLVTMVKNVDARTAKMLEQFRPMLKQTPDGRLITGLDPNGPIFLAFLKLPSGPEDLQKLAIILKTKSYKDFRDGLLLGQEKKSLTKKGNYEFTAINGANPIYFIDKGGYTVITPSEKTAEKMSAEKLKGLDKQISEAQAKTLLKSDLGLYVSMDVFNKEYAEQIKEAKAAIKEVFEQAQQALGESNQVNLQAVVGMIQGMFQAVEDSQGLLATLEFRPTAATFHLDSEFRKGTKTSKTLAPFTAKSFERLGQLPNDQLFYLGFDLNKNLFEKLGSWATGFGLQEKDVQALAKAGPKGGVQSVDLPLSGVQAWDFEKPALAVEAYLKLYRNMEQTGAFFQNMPLKAKPKIKAKAQKYGDTTFHSAQMVWDFEKLIKQAIPQGAPVPDELIDQMTKMYKGMLGEKLNVWFGKSGNQLVTVSANDWNHAKKLLDKYTSGKGAGASVGFKQALKNLPKKSSVVALVDLERYGELILNVVKQFGAQLPIPDGQKSETPGYVGFSVTLSKERASLDLAITTLAARNIGQRWVFPLLWAD